MLHLFKVSEKLGRPEPIFFFFSFWAPLYIIICEVTKWLKNYKKCTT